MLTFTKADQRTLEQLRLNRLVEVIEPMRRTMTCLDSSHTFNIYCVSPHLVDELLAWNAAQEAQVILGCQTVNIWFAGELVWSHPETEEQRSP